MFFKQVIDWQKMTLKYNDVAQATESSRYVRSKIMCDHPPFPLPSPPPLSRLIFVMYLIC